MNDFLFPLEKELFFLINGMHSPLMDAVMWLYSGMKIWMPVMLALIGVLVYQKSWREWLPVIIALTGLVLLADFVSSGIFKPWAARPRPTGFPGVMELVRTLGERTLDSGSYGFISGHTTQSFALAAFTALLFRKRIYTWLIVSWAGIMGFSRIYLGVHFVTDVLGGMIAGVVLAFLVFRLYRWTASRESMRKCIIPAEYPDKRIKLLSLGMIGYVLLFSLLSQWLVTFLR